MLRARSAEDLRKEQQTGWQKPKLPFIMQSHASFEDQPMEADAQSRCGKSEDYIEGVTAFLEKRPAIFKGQINVMIVQK